MAPSPRKPMTRDEKPFRYGAGCGMPAYSVLAGVPFHLLFTDLDAIVEAYTKGRPLAEELFGPEVGMGGPGWAGNSYGHINGLGGELTFPEGSEVGASPIYDSLDEGIAALRREVVFEKQGMFPFYLDLWERLKRAFPEHNPVFTGFKAEGPITSAWLLRGHDFFMDILDRPDLAKEYMSLVTSSTITYSKLIRRINGRPEFTEDGQGLADDGAAMISPALWPDLVMPCLERHYAEQTSGVRSGHIEDLKVDHLRFLDELRLDAYDPSVSPKLTPALICDNCKVPFAWRLNSTHYPGRTPEEIEQWVVDAAADGASTVSTIVGRTMCTPECAEKVRAFIRAGKRVERLLAEGCPRAELRERATLPM